MESNNATCGLGLSWACAFWLNLAMSGNAGARVQNKIIITIIVDITFINWYLKNQIDCFCKWFRITPTPTSTSMCPQIASQIMFTNICGKGRGNQAFFWDQVLNMGGGFRLILALKFEFDFISLWGVSFTPFSWCLVTFYAPAISAIRLFCDRDSTSFFMQVKLVKNHSLSKWWQHYMREWGQRIAVSHWDHKSVPLFRDYS